MANEYITVATLRAAMAIPAVSGDADAALLLAIEAASRAIDAECDRFFYDAGSASRTFDVTLPRRINVADFHTTTGLVVKTDENDDGTYETTWTINTDYVVEPLVPEPGWPWDKIRAVGTRTFPTTRGYRPRIQVTARWGWAAVPAQIQLAALQLAQKLYDRRNSVQGVLGFGDTGYAVRIARTDPDIARLLSPFDARPVLVG